MSEQNNKPTETIYGFRNIAIHDHSEYVLVEQETDDGNEMGLFIPRCALKKVIDSLARIHQQHTDQDARIVLLRQERARVSAKRSSEKQP